MITEIITFSLAAPADLSDATSPTTIIVRDFLTGITAAEGAHSAHFGQFQERPEMVVVFVDWDSVDAHTQFMATDEYKKVRESVAPVVSPSNFKRLAHFPAVPHSVRGEHPDVHVSEVVFCYFPASLTSEDISAINDSLDKLRPMMERSESLCLHDGWAQEDDLENPNPEHAGEKSKLWISVVGWADVAAHMRMQQSADFAENIHYLLGIKSITGTEIYHTALMKV